MSTILTIPLLFSIFTICYKDTFTGGMTMNLSMGGIFKQKIEANWGKYEQENNTIDENMQLAKKKPFSFVKN